ncbi:MAG: AbrB/MazE/SpoVT family DNA-binding domain-containing protein [Gammaproteobacteria bacterium]|nr:AbrB/MazE/SpoVT family DNA-binding domain-containing protein [Gammaproteobacteria bacterium]MDE0274022.1 AbrB/MazE/SpoVT family DNA-binding domain-containing protein [Gammaproteobacteria bacterium]
MTITLTVTAEGQVTLQKDVLRHLGVRPGDKLSVELLSNHRIELRSKPSESVSTIFGMLEQSNTERLTIEKIGEATAAGVATTVDAMISHYRTTAQSPPKTWVEFPLLVGDPAGSQPIRRRLLGLPTSLAHSFLRLPLALRLPLGGLILPRLLLL